jgi:hypothetical protein
MRIVAAYGEFLPEWGRRLLRDTYASVKPVFGKRPQQKRPGMLRRLERSIRKRRKAFLMKVRSKGRADRLPIN